MNIVADCRCMECVGLWLTFLHDAIFFGATPVLTFFGETPWTW